MTDEKQPEEWRPVHIPEFSSYYEVSNHGQVRRTDSGRILRSSSTGLHSNQQLKLRLHNGEHKNLMVAHLAMGAFREDPEGRAIGYSDGNSKNCAPDNLYFIKKPGVHGNEGGHASTMLGLSIAKIQKLIWDEILKESSPSLTEHASCPLYAHESLL